MSAAAIRSWRHGDRPYDVWDLIPFSVGGAMMGCFAVAAAFVIDSLYVVGVLHFSGAGIEGDNALTPQWVVAVTAVLVIVVSVLVGRWLFGLRRWIGSNDPADYDTASRKRRHFTVCAMFAYTILTPGVWVVMVGVMNST